MEIIEYSLKNRKLWDAFVSQSKNANFQHFRDYLEYHSDRFVDCSLIFFDKGDVVAILPAHLDGTELHSHDGLTFGGLLIKKHTKQKDVLLMLGCLREYAVRKQLSAIVMKLQPFIYNLYPSEEIHYALFNAGARLLARNVSGVIEFSNTLPFSKGRKWSFKKSLRNGISICESKDFELFIAHEKDLLAKKYNSKPVHTAAELKTLQEKFPENISMWLAYVSGRFAGGTILYNTDKVIKCQYICSTEEGRNLHVLDFLFHELIHNRSHTQQYLDFGHSNANSGFFLEHNLIQNKESYGARAVCYDSYIINI